MQRYFAPRSPAWRVSAIVMGATLASWGSTNAMAEQLGPRAFTNPPVLLQKPLPPPKLNYALPSGNAHTGTERAYDLSIQYTDGEIYDPTADRYQKVRLRSYVGATASKTPFIAPLIETAPGDTVRISLNNKLPVDPSCTDAKAAEQPDVPHCFNGTNLHSHGLWVSPAGNSDNVLLSLLPGVQFQYEYNIPADHPAGTFWYHPHLHGSTALQVSSGMAGALIVKGNRKPYGKAGSVGATNGDLETLLVSPGLKRKAYPDRTLVFQQIQYACEGANGKLKYNQDGTINWNCEPNETGVIESYDQFGPGSWAKSGRWTSINGTVLPTFQGVEAGQVERWRTIHAGVRDTINFRIVRADFSAVGGSMPALGKGNLADFLNKVCTGFEVPYQVVAADGLTMQDTFTTSNATLQPGYRFDMLTLFPERGVYCLMEGATPKAASVSAAPESPNLLGFVSVGGIAKIKPENITKTLVQALTASAKAHMPRDVVHEIVADLNAVDDYGKPAPKLTRFVPHPTVTDNEIAASGQKQEELVFFIGLPKSGPNAGKTLFEVGNSFAVEENGGEKAPQGASPYAPGRMDRTFTLGAAQQWELRSYSVSHPFHIHVNPFQIMGIFDPNGKDVSLPGVTEADGDTQFAGLKNVWKDTIFVKTNLNPGDLTDPPTKFYRVVVRTRYQRYIGTYVLHCHILDHEDQGMMQNVTIAVPNGQGGISNGHH